jgi:hypothetical protein
MAALRVFVGLADQLQVPPADGLAEQVRAASCDHGIKRWRLYLTQEHKGSVAYGLWLQLNLTESAPPKARTSASPRSDSSPPSTGSAALPELYVVDVVWLGWVRTSAVAAGC